MTEKKYRNAVYKLEPNAEQESKMLLHCKASGEMFNVLLNYSMEVRATGASFPSWYDLCRIAQEKRKEFDWDGEIYAKSLTIAAKNLRRGIENYFDQRKCGLKPSMPRHKRERDMNSYGYPDRVRFATERDHLNSNRFIKLPKVGFVKYHNDFEIPGKIVGTKIYRIREGTIYSWFANLRYEYKESVHSELPRTNVPIGIDMGLKTRLALSNGITIPISHPIERYESVIAKEFRKLEAIPKCSKAYRKQLGRVTRIHKKIRNARHNDNHNIAKMLVENYNPIYLEKLEITKMIGKAHTSERRKHYHDAAWKQLVDLIQYKAEDRGVTVIFVNPYNTSQICSGCGRVVQKDESIRIHNCPFCGLVEDRDINAAKNILKIGLGLQAKADVPESQGTGNSTHSQGRDLNPHECVNLIDVKGGDTMQSVAQMQ